MPYSFSPGTDPFPLAADQSWPATHHQFDEDSIWAVRTALAARRPLLIRGEPGIGKSQLARAAAQVLGVPFLYHVVHERCEVGDLLYSFDAVSRLAQAQVVGARRESTDEWKGALAEERFVRPGVLWWALDWNSATRQAAKFFRAIDAPASPPAWKPEVGGCVVLVDEIDKADSAVPNALLEALGNLGFLVTETGLTVALQPAAAPPLVVITTNEERELPAAFLRRCLVLQMPFPARGLTAEAFLRQRARAHFTPQQISGEVCDEVIRQLLADRAEAPRHGLTKPGAAEFLDLLRALVEMHRGKTEFQQEEAQLTALASIAGFALRKNPAEDRM